VVCQASRTHAAAVTDEFLACAFQGVTPDWPRGLWLAGRNGGFPALPRDRFSVISWQVLCGIRLGHSHAPISSRLHSSPGGTVVCPRTEHGLGWARVVRANPPAQPAGERRNFRFRAGLILVRLTGLHVGVCHLPGLSGLPLPPDRGPRRITATFTQRYARPSWLSLLHVRDGVVT